MPKSRPLSPPEQRRQLRKQEEEALEKQHSKSLPALKIKKQDIALQRWANMPPRTTGE